MKKQSLAIAFFAILLSGCTWLTPNYQRPALDIPEEWTAKQDHNNGNTTALQDWWDLYHDSVLHKLIMEVLDNNGDLNLVAARLQQVQAQYNYSYSDRLPLLSVTGIGSRSQLNGANSSLLSKKPGNLAFIGGVLSYELDLWGKQETANQAAKATVMAAVYNQDAIKLSVTATTAQLYFTILALDTNISITREAIRAREESYKIVKKQYDYEAVSGLVLHQSEAELEATRAQLPDLLEQKDKAESSLSVLLGRSPLEIVENEIIREASIDRLIPPPARPNVLPSTLLERRPDIAAAEESLIAANYNIGVARAAYFPTISLSSLLGVSNVDIQNLYNGTLHTWQLGASLSGPIFDFGRTSAGVELATAKNNELMVSYKNAVRSAFKEVKDAISKQEYSQKKEQTLINEEKTLKEALRLANLRYEAGYSGYIEVLDAERNLYNVQLALVTAKLNKLNASVELYKAIGGGWSRNLYDAPKA